VDKMAAYGRALIHQLLENADYLAASDRSIPEAFRVANEDPKPMFIQADFGIDANGEPKLVEIQGFPSIYAYQPILAQAYLDIYELSDLRYFLIPDYWPLLRRAIVGDHDPEHVILMEIDPAEQKTLPDFLATEEHLGIGTVSVTDIRKRGNRLYHGDTPIRRIYNRVIVDELIRKNVQTAFDWRDDLDVEWAGHPNWYFRISKFSLPYLKHPCVPRTYFVKDLPEIPRDPENWVLKPLYSFAGLGVVVGPTREQIAAADPDGYILQEKIDFAPIVATPAGPTKAEIRVMYVWLDELRAATTIVRMGRGKMMGVDHNRDMEWVGASACLIPETL